VVDSIPQPLGDEVGFLPPCYCSHRSFKPYQNFEFLSVIAMGGIRSFNLWMMKWVFFPHDTALTFWVSLCQCHGLDAIPQPLDNEVGVLPPWYGSRSSLWPNLTFWVSLCQCYGLDAIPQPLDDEVGVLPPCYRSQPSFRTNLTFCELSASSKVSKYLALPKDPRMTNWFWKKGFSCCAGHNHKTFHTRNLQ